MRFTFTLIFLVLSFGSKAQVYVYSELANVQKESTYAFEKQVNAIFLKLLNDYRTSKKKEQLRWSDSLWLAARNHCVWMTTHRQLEHQQGTSYKKWWTGKAVRDRVTYVLGGKLPSTLLGENILYNSDAYPTLNAQERAEAIAKQCFEQWRTSPNHNRNMLLSEYRVCAVSLQFTSNNEVYACLLMSGLLAK